MNFIKLFEKKSLIAAHRGASSIAPENTLLAMKKSIGYCDFIEIDAQLSSDGVAVIIHDKTLDRTTNVKKIYKDRYPYNVCDFTLNELYELDFGNEEKLLTLKRALEFIKENSLYLNIEIKDMKHCFSNEQAVTTVLREIQNLALEEQVLISSFRGEYLTIVKETSPNIATAFLANSNRDDLIEYLKKLGVDVYHIDKKLVNKSLVDRLKTEGFFIGVYVVNEIEAQKKLFDIGINSIFSDSVREDI